MAQTQLFYLIWKEKTCGLIPQWDWGDGDLVLPASNTQGPLESLNSLNSAQSLANQGFPIGTMQTMLRVIACTGVIFNN